MAGTPARTDGGRALVGVLIWWTSRETGQLTELDPAPCLLAAVRTPLWPGDPHANPLIATLVFAETLRLASSFANRGAVLVIVWRHLRLLRLDQLGRLGQLAQLVLVLRPRGVPRRRLLQPRRVRGCGKEQEEQRQRLQGRPYGRRPSCRDDRGLPAHRRELCQRRFGLRELAVQQQPLLLREVLLRPLQLLPRQRQLRLPNRSLRQRQRHDDESSGPHERAP